MARPVLHRAIASAGPVPASGAPPAKDARSLARHHLRNAATPDTTADAPNGATTAAPPAPAMPAGAAAVGQRPPSGSPDAAAVSARCAGFAFCQSCRGPPLMRLHIRRDLRRAQLGGEIGRPVGQFLQHLGAVIAPVEVIVIGLLRRDDMVAELDIFRRFGIAALFGKDIAHAAVALLVRSESVV